MVPIGKNYFYHEGKIYKEIKPDCTRSVPRYNLVTKTGKRKYITLKQIEALIDNINKK
jgi:hypothetical protein